jgi:hypothetical protein
VRVLLLEIRSERPGHARALTPSPSAPYRDLAKHWRTRHFGRSDAADGG